MSTKKSSLTKKKVALSKLADKKKKVTLTNGKRKIVQKKPVEVASSSISLDDRSGDWTITTSGNFVVSGDLTVRGLVDQEDMSNLGLLIEALTMIKADAITLNSGRWSVTETFLKVGDPSFLVIPTDQRIVEISQRNPMFGAEFRIRFEFVPYLDATRPLIASNIQKIIILNKAAFEILGSDIIAPTAHAIKKSLDELVDFFRVNDAKERAIKTNRALSSMLHHINKTIL